MKKILIIFLILVGLYLIFVNWGNIPGIPFGNKEDQVKVTNGVDMIDIDISSINTTIVPENRDDVKAELKGKGKLTVEKNGDTINVKYENNFNWFNWISFFDRSKLTIYIPEDYEQSLNLKVGSGNINFPADDMKLDKLVVDIKSGNVNLKKLTAETFELDVASGNSKINTLHTESSAIEIHSGNTDIDEFIGKLDANISSGRLDIQMEELTDSIDAEVKSGLLKIDLPNNADFTLDAKVRSGHIANDFELDNSTQEKGKIKGVHGTGKHKISLDVSSGKIDLE